MSTITHANFEMQMLDQIFEKGVLVDLDASWWAGQRKLRPQDLGIPVEEIDMDLFSLGRKRFIPKNWIGNFRKHEQACRLAISENSFRYTGQMAWFLPLTSLEYVVEQLEFHKKEFFKVVEEFKKEYPRIKEQMIQKYSDEVPKIYERLKHLAKGSILTIEKFRESFMTHIKEFYPQDPTQFFRLEWTFFEFTLPRGTEAVKVDLKKKMDEKEIETEKKRAIIKKYQESMTTQVNDFLVSVTKSLRNSTFELVSKINEQMNDGNITDKRLERLRSFVEKFRRINFINDYEMERELKNLEELIKEKNANDFKTNEDLETSLKKAFSSVVAIATKDDSEKIIKEAFGSVGRKVGKKK